MKKLIIGQDNTPESYDMPNGVPYMPHFLQPGTYHVDFKWSQLAPATIYPYWYYYSGTTAVSVKGG